MKISNLPEHPLPNNPNFKGKKKKKKKHRNLFEETIESNSLQYFESNIDKIDQLVSEINKLQILLTHDLMFRLSTNVIELINKKSQKKIKTYTFRQFFYLIMPLKNGHLPLGQLVNISR